MGERIVVGVDISKATFDADWDENKGKFNNAVEGFEKFAREIPKSAHVVMEATGTYHLKLATWLYENGVPVSVVNSAIPLYYARMAMKRAKTDKVDAGTLRRYGESEKPALWRPAGAVIIELNQLDSCLVSLQSARTAVTNRIEALTKNATVSSFVLAQFESQVVELDQRISACEREMRRLVLEHFAELYRRLLKIPGIGQKTAVMFIVLTDGFTRFPSAKQFSSYLGLSSYVYQSGESIRGRGSITRMGNRRMRQLLYMAALSARKHNPACVEFARRLTSAGKPVKVVRIAVANKLIRQAFAVALKNEPFSTAYA